jgi:phosphonate transport system substrate-binding protein
MSAAPTTASSIGVLLLLMSLLSAACSGSDQDTLVIAVQPSATQEELSAQAGELEAFLEARTEADIELRFPTSFGGVIESLRFGHADAAFMSAWPSWLAKKHAGAEVVLAEVREVSIGDQKAEEPFYFSYWIVPKDSPYNGLEDLRGKKVAFPSQLSTSGYVAPLAKLVELGLVDRPEEGKAADPSDFFGEVIFAGGYSQAWEALSAGQVDIAIVAGDVPVDLYDEVLGATRVLEEQGPIPSHGVVFSKDFEEPLRTEVKEALLELGQPEHRELMRKFVSGIFVRFEETTTEQHLASLSKFLSDTNVEFQEMLRQPQESQAPAVAPAR